MLRSSPLFQLYLVRMRDFYRQPARVFWVYGFPTIMAVALGFAFQNRPPAPIAVDLVQKSGADEVKAAVKTHNAALEAARLAKQPQLTVPAIEVKELSRDEALERLKTGQTAARHRAAWSHRQRISLRSNPARGRRRSPSG